VSTAALGQGILMAASTPHLTAIFGAGADSQSDAEIMLRVKTGDQSAFDYLVQKYRRPMVSFMYRMARNSAAAEDLAQEVFLRVYRSRETYEASAKFTTWLYRIATNLSLDHLRRRRPPTVPLDSAAVTAEDVGGAATREPPMSLIETALERSEMSQCVQSYLETLPDDYRVAVLLHDVYGLSNPEIAQLLGCSVATAKIRLHRARRRLREVLDAACAFDIDERGVLVCEPAPFSARANTAR